MYICKYGVYEYTYIRIDICVPTFVTYVCIHVCMCVYIYMYTCQDGRRILYCSSIIMAPTEFQYGSMPFAFLRKTESRLARESTLHSGPHETDQIGLKNYQCCGPIFRM